MAAILHTPRLFVRQLMTGTLIALLGACGGGSDGVSTPVSQPAAASMLSGTAATGAAIVGGVVTLKCASGTTAAPITGADGAFSVDVSGATLPCLVKVSYKDASGAAQELHSLASATGTVNVTPFTEMLLAAASGGAPSALFAAAKPDLAAVSSKLPAALATVKARLDSLGVDTTNLPKNPLSDKFTPAIGNGAGDAADKVLDDLKLKLGSTGKTLNGVVGEVAIGQTTNNPVTTGATTSTTATTTATTTTTTPTTNTETTTTTVVASPTVSSFTPNTGPVSTSVSITGANLGSFTPAPLVKFGTVNAGGPYTNVSNTNVTFKVPAGLAVGAHSITIANFDGSGVITVGTFNVTAVVGTSLTAPMVASGSKFGGAVMGALNLAGTYTPVTLSPNVTFTALTTTKLATDGVNMYAYGIAGANVFGIQKINKTTGVTSILATGTVASITSDGTDVFVATSGAAGSLGKTSVSTFAPDIQLFRITPAGSVSLIATLSSVGVGRFAQPISAYAGPIAVAHGKLYIALNGIQQIKAIDLATNTASTLTFGDNGCNAYMVCDGIGTNTVSGTGASFNNLEGEMTTDGTYLYVLEAGNAYPGIVRQVSIADGSVKTLGGITRFLFANYSSWLRGTGITTDGAGNVYVVNPTASQIIKYEIATGNAAVVATGSAAGTNCATTASSLSCAGFNGAVISDGTNLFTFNGGVLVKIQ